MQMELTDFEKGYLVGLIAKELQTCEREKEKTLLEKIYRAALDAVAREFKEETSDIRDDRGSGSPDCCHNGPDRHI